MQCSSTCRRTGFTLVEILVALTLIAVGVTAWVGTASVAVRLAGAARRGADAQHRARTRAELLAAGSCRSMTSGGSSSEAWTIHAGGNGVRVIHVEVPYRAGGGSLIARYDMLAFC